jgi:hypothetical protein
LKIGTINLQPKEFYQTDKSLKKLEKIVPGRRFNEQHEIDMWKPSS